MFQLIGIGAHGRRHRAQTIKHVGGRNQALIGGIQNLCHHVIQVTQLRFGQQHPNVRTGAILLYQVAVADPGLKNRRCFAARLLPQVGQLHGVADKIRIFQQLLLVWVNLVRIRLLRIQGTTDSSVADVSSTHLRSDRLGQGIHLGTECLHIPSFHRVIQRGIGTGISGKVGVLRRCPGMVVEALATLGFQV